MNKVSPVNSTQLAAKLKIERDSLIAQFIAIDKSIISHYPNIEEVHVNLDRMKWLSDKVDKINNKLNRL